jgi:cell division protease FtsH
VNISNRIIHALTLLFLFNTTISTFAAEPAITHQPVLKQEEPQEAQLKLEQDMIEIHLKPIVELYRKLDFTLEYLIQVINNNQIRGCKKAEALDHIKGIRLFIAQINATSGSINQAQQISLINTFFKLVGENIKKSLANGLTSFTELDQATIENAIKRSGTTSFDQIKAVTAENEKLLKSIEAETNRAGLSLFNRIYRRTEKFVVDHRILPRTAYALVAGLFLAQIIATLRPDTCTKPILDNEGAEVGTEYTNKIMATVASLQRYIGQVPRYDKFGGVTNTDELKALGHTYMFLHDIGILNFTLPALLSWTLFKDQASEAYNSSSTWLSKQWEVLRSKFNGGPIIRKVESWDKEPKARFPDVIGKEHVKQALIRMVEYIRDHERFDRANIKPPAGYLFNGPSRSGKTFIAEALAGEIKDALAALGTEQKFHFLNFTAAEVLNIGITKIMAFAQYNAPCVLFIDEIDMLGAQRDRNAQVLAELLTAMSGVMMSQDNSRQVIILGATNAPQNLDHALLQPGRFEKVLWFSYPTVEERAQFLIKELDKRAIMTVAPEYIYRLAQETDGLSFEGLRSIIITALQYARAESESLSPYHLERAFDEEHRLIIYEQPPVSDLDKKCIALHQAGHTLATMLLDQGESVAKVTICPVNIKTKEEPTWMRYMDEKEKQESVENGKLFTVKKETAGSYSSHDELVAQLKIDLAGHVAEKIILGDSGYTYHRHDNQKALSKAKYLIFKGMRETDFPKDLRNSMQSQAYELMKKCEQEVTELLSQRKELLIKIADALVKYICLTGYDIEQLMQGKPLPLELALKEYQEQVKKDEAPQEKSAKPAHS